MASREGTGCPFRAVQLTLALPSQLSKAKKRQALQKFFLITRVARTGRSIKSTGSEWSAGRSIRKAVVLHGRGPATVLGSTSTWALLQRECPVAVVVRGPVAVLAREVRHTGGHS